MDVVRVVGAGLVGAHVGVADERDTVGREHPRELLGVPGDHVALGMDEGVEAEDQVDRAIRDHRQRRAVVDVEAHAPVACEALPAVSHRRLGDVHGDQLVAELAQVVRPAPYPGAISRILWAGTNAWIRENNVTHH